MSAYGAACGAARARCRLPALCAERSRRAARRRGAAGRAACVSSSDLGRTLGKPGGELRMLIGARRATSA